MSKLLQLLEEQWICPIDKTPIIQPVLTVDGHTYQKESIQQWLSDSNKSPKTGLQLKTKTLVPNLALKNLKENILYRIPQQTDNIQRLQNQNKSLKIEVKILREQIFQIRQIHQVQSQITIRERSLKTKSFSMVEQKKMELKDLQKQVQKLEQKVRSLNRKQSNLKNQHSKACQKYQFQIKQFVIKEQKATQLHQKVKQKTKQMYCKIISNLQQNIDKFIFIIMSIIDPIVKCKKKQKDEKTRQRIAQIQKIVESCFKEIAENQRYNKYFDDYNFIKQIVKNLKIDPFEVDPGFMIKSCLCVNRQFAELFKVISFPTFQAITKIKKTKDQFNLQFIQGIYSEDKVVGNKDYQTFISHSKDFQSISCIVMINSIISEIKKKDLQQFRHLQYVNFTGSKLTNESKRQLNTYQRENPNIVVVYDEAQVQENEEENEEINTIVNILMRTVNQYEQI